MRKTLLADQSISGGENEKQTKVRYFLYLKLEQMSQPGVRIY